jgi:hypothetical protein
MITEVENEKSKKKTSSFLLKLYQILEVTSLAQNRTKNMMRLSNGVILEIALL